MKRAFYRWLKATYPGIRLRPWQKRVVAVYWSAPPAGGKTFLRLLLGEFEQDGDSASSFFRQLSERGLARRRGCRCGKFEGCDICGKYRSVREKAAAKKGGKK